MPANSSPAMAARWTVLIRCFSWESSCTITSLSCTSPEYWCMTRAKPAFQPTEMRSSRRSPRRLALLGATGSIGRQVCDLVERHPDRFTLHALVAGSDAAALEAVARRHPEAHALLAHAPGADPVRAGRA